MVAFTVGHHRLTEQRVHTDVTDVLPLTIVQLHRLHFLARVERLINLDGGGGAGRGGGGVGGGVARWTGGGGGDDGAVGQCGMSAVAVLAVEVRLPLLAPPY